MLSFFELGTRFHNKHENDEFEVKSEPIEREKISKIILSFINGSADKQNDYIIMGVAETNDGKANFDTLYSVKFNQGEGKFHLNSKRKNTPKYDNVEDCIKKIKDYLHNNTTPSIDRDNHIQINLEKIETHQKRKKWLCSSGIGCRSCV